MLLVFGLCVVAKNWRKPGLLLRRLRMRALAVSLSGQAPTVRLSRSSSKLATKTNATSTSAALLPRPASRARLVAISWRRFAELLKPAYKVILGQVVKLGSFFYWPNQSKAFMGGKRPFMRQQASIDGRRRERGACLCGGECELGRAQLHTRCTNFCLLARQSIGRELNETWLICVSVGSAMPDQTLPNLY